ncbi:DUF892 family protein [Aquibium microcysteis]|uniref:DUF892 family protein n=1 Tax=Aquibium microcysteis TaxID=675281 RepID=UPI00165D2BEC|nr:DUF892 family protein [Aquibium microcysteis]
MTTHFTDKARDIFIVGLRNAHAMENQALAIMKPQAERIESYPQVLDRLRRHIAETETQIQRLDTVLAGFDESASALKDAYTSLITLAEAGGFAEAQSLLRQNLDEERAMASWVEDNLPAVTLQHAELRAAGASAKV